MPPHPGVLSQRLSKGEAVRQAGRSGPHRGGEMRQEW